MKRLFGLLLIILAGRGTADAQDPAFSQVFNNRLYLNPAFAGVDETHRVTLAHRNMWRVSLPRNYVTTTASYDFKPCAFPRIGFGFIAMSDVEGDGRLKSTEAGAMFAVHNPYSLNRRRKAHSAGSFSFSLQTSLISRSIDWSKLIFADQLSPVNGVVHPQSQQARPNDAPVNNVDFAFGFLWRQRFYVSKTLDMTFHAGYAVHHILRPQVGLLVNGIMPTRHTLHAGALIPMSKAGYLVPGFRYMGQHLGYADHKSLDINVMYLVKNVFAGASYRMNHLKDYDLNTDALVLMAGYEFDFSKQTALRLTYSFDGNFKGVSRGNFFTHEINLIFVMENTCKGQLARMNKNICDYQGKGLPRIF